MYQIYDDGLPGVVNHPELARLCQDIAYNLGLIQYQLDDNKNHCLVLDKYKLILSVIDRPKARVEPRLKIEGSLAIVGLKGRSLDNYLSSKEQKEYTMQITVAISRGPAAI